MRCAAQLAPMDFVELWELWAAEWADIDLKTTEGDYLVTKTYMLQIVSLLDGQLPKPVGSTGGFHPDACRWSKCHLKLVGIASPMVESTIQYLAGHRINHCYLLKSCVKIASYWCVVWLLPSELGLGQHRRFYPPYPTAHKDRYIISGWLN